MKLYSRKNDVFKENDRVVKQFSDQLAFCREHEMVKMLKEKGLAVPPIIDATDNVITYEWLGGVSYHALIDRFEQKHATALVDWLECYYSITGLCRGDVNLRNFIYLEDIDKCYSVDFEDECTIGRKEEDFGRIIAFAATYEPPFSSAKIQCGRLLIKAFLDAGANIMQIRTSYIDEINAMITRRKSRRYDINTALQFWEDIR